jgi:type IV pilus assembly protein PilB
MARKRLGEILLNAGVLSEPQLRAALVEQRRWGGPIGRILVDMRLITEDAMVQALSHQLNFPAVKLDGRAIPQEVLDLVPAELAESHGVMPFSLQGKFLDVAMADPTNLGIIDELRIRTRLNVRPYLAGPKAIERAIARCYGRGMATLSFGDSGLLSMEPPSATRAVAAAAVAAGGVVQAPIGSASEASSPVSGAAGPSPATARRAAQFELTDGVAAGEPDRGREIASLQARVQRLEAHIARDEDVLRKLLALLVEKGLATREEILERIR